MIKQVLQMGINLQALKMRISSMLSEEDSKEEEVVEEEEWVDFNPFFKIYLDFKDNKKHHNNRLDQSMPGLI